MTDDQLDEWTPEAMANYDAAHARLISTLDQFTAGLRAAMPLRTEGPELEALREQVDRSLADLDRASGELTGEYFSTIAVIEDLDDDADDDVDEQGDPDEGAGLGVSVIWRFDLRVDRPRALSERARDLYSQNYPEMEAAELDEHTGPVGAALQAITELAGLDELMGTDGLTPLGGLRVFVATEDLLDGGDGIDPLFDAERGEPKPWSREVGAVFLPAEGEIGITEGFNFA